MLTAFSFIFSPQYMSGWSYNPLELLLCGVILAKAGIHPDSSTQNTNLSIHRLCCLQFGLSLFSPVLRTCAQGTCEILYVPHCACPLGSLRQHLAILNCDWAKKQKLIASLIRWVYAERSLHCVSKCDAHLLFFYFSLPFPFLSVILLCLKAETPMSGKLQRNYQIRADSS